MSKLNLTLMGLVFAVMTPECCVVVNMVNSHETVLSVSKLKKKEIL